MTRRKGSLKLGSNIEPQISAPLDARAVVATIADLTQEGNYDYPYEGMTVFVLEDRQMYVLQGEDPTQSAAWAKLVSGGSGGDYDTIKLSDIDKLFVTTP